MNSSHHSTLEMPDDAMINEGGAIRQPTMHDTEVAYEHLRDSRHCHVPAWRDCLQSPTAMFWTSFATGVAISLLEPRQDGRK